MNETKTDPVLEKARELGLVVPAVQALHRRILREIERGGRLDMSWWHGDYIENAYANSEEDFCGTTHCRAGWTTHLAGDAGRKLEADCVRLRHDISGLGGHYTVDGPYSHPVAVAAELIVRASCPGSVFEGGFYTTTRNAMERMRELAELEPPIDDTVQP